MRQFRCRPLFLALFLALTLCGAARADDDSALNGYLRDHQDGVAVTCWYEDENDAENAESLFCAVYGGDGALLTVANLDPKKGQQTVVAKCDTALVDCAKLFAADAERKPLGPALTLKPAAANSDIPQFMSGYPVVSENSVSVSGSAMARVKVMTDRACRLYWALYKKDAGYATAARFISNNLPGSEKHSMMVMTANQSALVTLTGLEDETAYDLDLWLTNSDFTASSYITRLSFTTVDGTPPEFRVAPNVSAAHERSVTVQYSLNEAATLYWVLLESGSQFPNPPTGGGAITTDYAVKQVISGNGGLNHGKASAKANATGTFQAQGLTPQKSYDIWYVAQDAAGNNSEFRLGTPDSGAANDPRDVCLLTVHTLDKQPPTVTQELTKCPDDSPTTPYADTDVRLIFSEGIRRFSTGETLTDLYDAVKSAANDDARASAKEKLAAFLRETVVLQSGSGTSYAAVPERTDDESEWTVDYRNAAVAWEGENLVLTFPTTDDAKADSALKLYGGKSYRFLLRDLSDLSENLNRITSLTTDAFTTMPAQIQFKEISLNNLNYPPGLSVVDLSFSASPVAVSRAGSDAAWDLLFWSDTTCSFEVYRRSRLSTSVVYDQAWAKMQSPTGFGGQGSVMIPVTAEAGTMAGQSMHLNLCQYNSGNIPTLNSLEDGRVYEYAVRLLEVNGETDRGLWEAEVSFEVSAVAGSASALVNLAANLTKARLTAAKSAGNAQEIGSPVPFRMTRTFIATSAPAFVNGAPTFIPGDTTVSMWFQMTRPGTVHYLLAPADGTVTAKDLQNRTVDWKRYQEIPESGENAALTPFSLSSPNWMNIAYHRFSGAGVRTDSLEIDDKGGTFTVTGLKSETHYFAYFVLQGASGSVYSTSAQLFRFTTLEAAPPSVQMSLKNPIATFSTNQEAVVDYAVVDIDGNALDPLINNVFWNNAPSGGRQAISSYQVDSVLQAMCLNTGNGSVFDVYATADYKNRVAAYIRQSLMDGDSVIGIGKGVRVSPTASLSVDCGLLPMKEGHKYAVLTVAQSVDGGSNVFRAVSPVVPPDSVPPMVTGITESLTMDGSDSIELNTCSGFATLAFDSPLYYLDSGTLKALDLGPHYSTLRESNYKPMVDIASSSPATQITVSSGQVAQVNHATSAINLTLTNAAPGASITFPTLLCDEYGNTHPSVLTVKLNVTTTLTGYDAAGRAVYIHKPALEISKSWDGRTAE